MATLDTINVGNLANDGTGDDLREAFIKVNNNFTELNTALVNVETPEGQNLGSGTGVFAQKIDETLQFKSLVAGAGISLSSGGSAITITGTNAGIEQLIVVSDNGSVVLPAGARTLRIQGGIQTQTRVTEDDLFIDVMGQDLVQTDVNPRLGGSLNGNGHDISNVTTLTVNNVVGNVHGIDVREISGLIDGFNFGSILAEATNIVDWIVLTTDVDFGSITSPIDIDADMGEIA